MRSRRKSLLALTALAALVSAALYSACFKPELDVEAFRCNEPPHACPDGYSCRELTPDDRRCIKEGHETPTFDMGPHDMKPPGDGPHPDGPLPDAGLKLNCSPPEVVVSTDLGGAALVATKQGEPVLLYRNASGIYHKNRKGSIWSNPILVTMQPTNFSAAMDDQDRLNVVYTDNAASTMYHCLREIHSTTCLITKEFAKADLSNVIEVTSFAVASNSGRTFAAIGIVDKLNKHKGVLIEAKPVGSPVNDISYTKFKCDQDKIIGDPNLREAALAVSPGHVVASYWLEKAVGPGFRVFSYPLNLTICNQGKENPLVTTNVALRMPVAIASGGVIHTAHGNHGPNVGLAHHYAWPFSAPVPMLPAKANEIWSPTTAVPESVDMALSGDIPVISLVANEAGKRRPVLLLHDPKAAGGWREIPLPKLADSHVTADHTRVAVSNNRIHLAFDGENKGKSSLFYVTCEGELPK